MNVFVAIITEADDVLGTQVELQVTATNALAHDFIFDSVFVEGEPIEGVNWEVREVEVVGS